MFGDVENDHKRQSTTLALFDEPRIFQLSFVGILLVEDLDSGLRLNDVVSLLDVTPCFKGCL